MDRKRNNTCHTVVNEPVTYLLKQQLQQKKMIKAFKNNERFRGRIVDSLSTETEKLCLFDLRNSTTPMFQVGCPHKALTL